MREESAEPGVRWRTAEAADLPFVQAAELAYIREREPEQEKAWLAVLDRNRLLWAENLSRTTVAEVGGTPVGYGMWAVVEEVPTVVTLHVAPSHRRRGLGRRLLDAVTDDVRRSGHDTLALGVHRSNPARHLYETAGFTGTGEDGDYLLFRRDGLSDDGRQPQVVAAPATTLAGSELTGDRGPVTDSAPRPSSHALFPAGGFVGDPAERAQWDDRYSSRSEGLWSGRPNGALVAEAADLEPGRVLDVGCGEGADAVWLAGRGWDVTALEVSGVALERAARHAQEAGVAITWVHAGLAEAALPPKSFDLVSAMYPALLRTPDAAAERALLAAVAPGGVLLLVHHAGMETHVPEEGRPDPADYVWPSMVAALLDDDWQVEVDEERPRVVPEGGAGAHHADDVVLRARRLR